jgi:hypothetical protein
MKNRRSARKPLFERIKAGLEDGIQFARGKLKLVVHAREEPMPEVKRKYPKEVFAERGDAIFEKDIRPHLKPKDNGKFLAIDIETGAYEIGADELKVVKKLRKRVPEAQIFLRRTDSSILHRLGGRGRNAT